MNIKYITAFFCISFFIAITFAFSQTSKPDARKEWLNGNYSGAIAICEQELSENPNNMESYVVLCWALVSSKQYRQAELRANQALKLNSSEARILEALAEAEYYLDKNDEAIDYFQRYIANSRENQERRGRAYYMMGEIYIRQAKYEHADIALSTAVRVEQHPSDIWWTRLGYARERIGDYVSAIDAYDHALTLNPSQYDAVSGKTRCQSRIR